MSFGEEQVSKKNAAAAKKILRREAGDSKPTRMIECFGGDVVEVPLLGVVEVAFSIGRRGVAKQNGHRQYVGDARFFVRPIETPNCRELIGVPGWVPVRVVER